MSAVLSTERCDKYCAQIWQRQQMKRTKILTYVELRLDVLKQLAKRFDAERMRFTAILNHSSTSGSWDTDSYEDEEESGNIYRLLSELRYLQSKTSDRDELDEIQRWIWTVTQALESDLPTFSFAYIPPEHYSRLQSGRV